MVNGTTTNEIMSVFDKILARSPYTVCTVRRENLWKSKTPVNYSVEKGRLDIKKETR